MSLDERKTEFGIITISDKALTSIAGITALNMEEVVALDRSIVADISSMLGKEREITGVHINSSEDEVSIDLYLHVRYGIRVPDLTLRLQEKVRTALEYYADVSVLAINVYVQSIVM